MSTADDTQNSQLCANPECSFHGHPRFGNFCSMCFKARNSSGDMTSNVSQPKVCETVEPKDEAPIVTPPVIEEVVEPTPAKTDSVIESKDEDDDMRPVQKNKKRCFECNKKVGLLGMECRCGYVYCGEHRFPDTHTCAFDFKEFDRKKLSDANQKVVAQKLEKF